MARTFLIEATPWDNAGNAVNVYLAGGGSRGYNHRGRTTWIAGIVKEPKFSAAIGFDEDGWTGGALPQASNVEFMPSDKATLTSIAGRQWIGAAITLLVGDDATAAPVWTTVLTGTVRAVSSSGGKLQFTVADLGAALADPFIKTTARFAGTTGIEGDSDIEGRVKRRTFGRAYNIEGRTLLKASNIFEFGDPSFPLSAFVTVKDMGRAAAPAPTVIAWAGSIAATLAALVASAPAGGSCCVAPSIACVKWWTQPSGPLTADIDGEVGTGFTNYVVEIAGRILTAAGGPAYSGNLANNYRADEAGIHVDDINESTASLLDRLLLGASLPWVLDPAGTVYIREFVFTGSVETITVEAIDMVEAYKPNTSRRIAYRRAYRVHNDGEISAAVLLADVADAGDLAALDYVNLGTNVLRSTGGPAITDAEALNSAVTMSAGGALSGAGGGQVTPAGLQTASGVGILNSRLTVGVDTGGTGGRARVIVLDNGVTLNLVQFPAVAQNLDISISSGLLNGIGTGTGTAVGNSLVSISASGALSGAGGGQVTAPGLGTEVGAGEGDNLIMDASMINTATRWTLSGSAAFAAGAAGDPFNYVRLTATGAQAIPNTGINRGVGSGLIPVQEGERIYTSALTKAEASNAGNFVNVKHVWKKSDGTAISTDTLALASSGTNWVYREVSSVAPALAAILQVYFESQNVSGGARVALPRTARTQRAATVGSISGTNLIASDGVTILTDTGATGVRNNALSLSAGGAFSGGGGGQILYDSLADGSTYAKVAATELSGGVPKLSVAGSGKRLADPRNLPAISAMNLGYKFTGAVTYSATAGTPATATISVAAGSSLIGSSSISYSAMSVGVTGTNNTTTTFYLYVDDATFAGGAQTLVATTTANTIYSSDARVYIGFCDVFFPASGGGTGGGGGGGGYCVAADAWVETLTRGFVPAREIVEGDLLRVLTLDRASTEWEPCEGSGLSPARGYRITSTSGIEVALSESTPITLRDGSIIRVCDIDGHALPVFDGEGFRWEACQAEPAGNFEVAHIRVNQRTYAAGDVPGRSILTHNPKP